MNDAILWYSMKLLNCSKYEISKCGYVRNVKTKYIFKNSICTTTGYIRIKMSNDNGKLLYATSLHVLLAQMFIPNPENKPTVDHNDRNILNNNLDNLRWATRTEQSVNRNHNRKGIEVYQLNIDGTIIKKWDKIQDAAKELNIKNVSISRCCLNKQITAGKFKWKYCRDVDDNTIPDEIWKLSPFVEYEKIDVSNYGRLKKKDGIITSGNKNRGELIISPQIINGTKRKKITLKVHRLVAATFFGISDDHVIHKDANKENNHIDNLAYKTTKELPQYLVDTNKRIYNSKKVNQYTNTGEFIKQYNSAGEAANLNNYNDNNMYVRFNSTNQIENLRYTIPHEYKILFA